MIKDREFIERTNEKIKRGSDRKREGRPPYLSQSTCVGVDVTGGDGSTAAALKTTPPSFVLFDNLSQRQRDAEVERERWKN